jgi:TetR/AcrR family acrAB operon transcriptional repressor
MVRRTKADALATRERILDAAERLFQARGVSRTSLHDIAADAGVTRGAVYWHFRDKGDLFSAMMDRVHEPIGAVRCTPPSPEQVLPQLRRHLVDTLQRVVDDPRLRRVIEIATQKAEYVDDLVVVRQGHLKSIAEHVDGLRACLEQLPGLRGARAHAIGLHALIAGLIHSWLLDPDAFELVPVGRRVIDTYLASLAAGVPSHAAPVETQAVACESRPPAVAVTTGARRRRAPRPADAP